MVSVAALPLIASAQLGIGARAVELPMDAHSIEPEASKIKVVGREFNTSGQETCATQHWPFFSKGCLRGSAGAIEPRQVSLAASATSSVKSDGPVKAARAIDPRQGNLASDRSSQFGKPSGKIVRLNEVSR